MILDSEQQRSLLLRVIGAVNFPGDSLDLAYQTKQAIKEAKVVSQEAPTQGNTGTNAVTTVQ